MLFYDYLQAQAWLIFHPTPINQVHQHSKREKQRENIQLHLAEYIVIFKLALWLEEQKEKYVAWAETPLGCNPMIFNFYELQQ